MIKSITRSWFIYLLLVAITLVVYLRAADYQLLHYDDNIYITDNPHIRQGITPESIGWALGGKYEANWIPLTWVSYMLDYQLCAGSEPNTGEDAVYHRTNILLHTLNVLLLFGLLQGLTGSRWRSALVAAIFAVHPLHVESVAWVAERKDVLSTFFMMLTMIAYVSYVRRPGIARYALMAVSFVLGLMAKSMLVTLPILLLLLDYWPLRRMGGDEKSQHVRVRKLIFEKLPLFALAIAVGLVTIGAQERGGAVRSLVRYPLGERLANAVVSYIAYLVKTVWPDNLACFYPHPHNTLPVWQVVGALVLLVVATYGAIRAAKKLPQVTVGWLWYLVTLLPVIGIVQVGAQGMADRYMYVPLVGLSIAAVWCAAELVRLKGSQKPVALALSAVLIACLMARAYSQVGVWKDDISLFTNAVEATKGNSQMEFNLADTYMSQGDTDQAAVHFRAAIDANPEDGQSHNNLAMILLQDAESAGESEPDAIVFQGARFSRATLAEAGEHFRDAIRLLPPTAGPHRYLACVLMIEGRLDDAIAEFEAALQIKPDDGTRDALREAMALRAQKTDH